MNVHREIMKDDSRESLHIHHQKIPALIDSDLMIIPGSIEEIYCSMDSYDDMLHRKKFILVYLILHGKVKIWLSKDSFELGPNNLLVVPENLVFEAPQLNLCKGYFVLFKSEFILPLLKHPMEIEFPFLGILGEHLFKLSKDNTSLFERIFVDLIREFNHEAGEKELLLQHYLEILLLKIRELNQYSRPNENNLPASSQRIISGFISLVKSHFQEIRMVKHYAEMLNISPGHLSDTVHEVLGKSPRSIINDMLVQEAQCLLRSSNLSIAEISFQLGFDDQAHFYHFMKLHTGNSPKDLRKFP